MPESPVQTAIAEWQDQQINGTQLMRRLVTFDKWMLPLSEAAAAEMLRTGTASRLLYSQDDARTAQGLCADLEAVVANLQGEAAQFDDITLVVVQAS